MLRSILTSLVVLCCAAPAASANDLQEIYDAGGDPFVVITLPSKGLQAARSCPSGGAACTPLPLAARYTPGETAAGTVFEFDFADGTTQRTSPWQGRLRSTAPPTVSGAPVAGSTVQGVPGNWAGGYGGGVAGHDGALRPDHSQLELVACSQPAGGECWVLGGAVLLTERWAGWYLAAREYRYSADTVFTAVGIIYPYRLRDLEGTTPLSAFARIEPAPSAPRSDQYEVILQSAPSSVTLRKRALRRNGRIHVGRVACTSRCDVTLRVSGGSRKPTITRFSAKGTRALKAPARKGKLRVRVYLDGALVKSGTVRS